MSAVNAAYRPKRLGVSFFTLNDAVSLLYGLRGLQVLGQWLRNWRAFWDADVTPADRSIANSLAFFVLIPLGVLLHEAGHSLATWQVGGRVVEFQWRVFWGYIVPAGNFTPAQDWWIAFSGPLVSILIGLLPIPLLPRLGRTIWGELLYAFVRHELFYALAWYPAISFLGFGGDWVTIYDFSRAPYAQVTLVVHLALLAGLWWLDRSAWAVRWRIGRDPKALAVLQRLEADAALRPGDAVPQIALAAFYHDHAEPRLSQRHETEAERLGPASAALKALQALMAFERKHYKKAEAAAEAALKGNLPPHEQARLHRVLGFSLMEAGRRPEAVAHFDASLSLQPEDSTTHYWRGIMVRALGRRDEARLDFHEAVRFAPDERNRARAQHELDSTR